MPKFISYTFHKNAHGGGDDRAIIGPLGDTPTHKVIEALQRERKARRPYDPDAITYRVIEARNTLDAIIQDARQPLPTTNEAHQ